MSHVYVLRLRGGRYYVGRTNNITQRYQQHIAGAGAAWTRRHRPVSVERVIENVVSPFEEDKVTKEYMSLHGIDNVRGGSYITVELDDLQKFVLNKEIRMSQGLCARCGRKGHFIKDCWAAKDVDGNEFSSEEEEDDDQHCYRCGRIGHFIKDCWASTDVYGNVLH